MTATKRYNNNNFSTTHNHHNTPNNTAILFAMINIRAHHSYPSIRCPDPPLATMLLRIINTKGLYSKMAATTSTLTR